MNLKRILAMREAIRVVTCIFKSMEDRRIVICPFHHLDCAVNSSFPLLTNEVIQRAKFTFASRLRTGIELLGHSESILPWQMASLNREWPGLN